MSDTNGREYEKDKNTAVDKIIKWQVNVLGTAESTQDIIIDVAENENAAQGFCVQALQQTKGRGRHGNSWESPMGNLYISFLLRPDCTLEDAGNISFVCAVALSDTISPYIDEKKHEKTLKWPNDILVDGLKLSGILLESGVKNNLTDYVAVGIGVNIFSPPEGENAIGLKDICKKPVYVNVFRDEFLDNMNLYYSIWKKKGFAPIRKKWLKHAHGLEKPITARFSDKGITGIFKGIDKTGRLIIETRNSTEKISAAEVQFQPPKRKYKDS